MDNFVLRGVSRSGEGRASIRSSTPGPSKDGSDVIQMSDLSDVNCIEGPSLTSPVSVDEMDINLTEEVEKIEGLRQLKAKLDDLQI